MQTSMRDTEIDRISGLPDELLDHILSFLPTKEAVQKSMISKRWTNLWASLPRLNFNQTDFVIGNRKERYAKFEKFGDMVLNHRKSSYIHAFHLRFQDFRYCDLVKTWINSCKKFSPRVLSIMVPVPSDYFLEFMFTCESVEDMSLKITNLDWSYVPQTVYLPRIRKLSLDNTHVDEDSLTRLFLGCPVLEDLSLEMCRGEFSSIFGQKLTSLSIIDCYDYKQKCWYQTLNLSDAVPAIVNLSCIRRLNLRTAYLDVESICKLFISCPLLEDLSLGNCYGEFSTLFKHKLKCLSLENCCVGSPQDTASWKIKKAIIRTNICGSTSKSSVLIECSFNPYRRTYNTFRCHSDPDPFLSKFICNPPTDMALDFCNTSGLAIVFSGVESLEFCTPAKKVDLKKVFRKIGAFYNLKNLSLRLADWCMDPYEFDIIAWFLDNSPFLEKLTLYNPKRQKKRGKHKRVVLHHETVYYNSLSIELAQRKKLKRVEIKFCKNLFSDSNFKGALVRDMEGLENIKVVISEFDE